MNYQDYIDRAQDAIDRKDRAANVEGCKGMKFGQEIENESASETNPTKYGFFVRLTYRSGKMNPGYWVEMTDGNGKFWEVCAGSIVAR